MPPLHCIATASLMVTRPKDHPVLLLARWCSVACVWCYTKTSQKVSEVTKHVRHPTVYTHVYLFEASSARILLVILLVMCAIAQGHVVTGCNFMYTSCVFMVVAITWVAPCTYVHTYM